MASWIIYLPNGTVRHAEKPETVYYLLNMFDRGEFKVILLD